jgi:hypothetical protein
LNGSCSTSENAVNAKFCHALALYCAENPAKFWSGYGGEWASLVAGPRSAGSDGYLLENPAKTEAQAGRHAPQEIGKLTCPMRVTLPWRSSSTTFSPAPCALAPLDASCAHPSQKRGLWQCDGGRGDFVTSCRSVCARIAPPRCPKPSPSRTYAARPLCVRVHQGLIPDDMSIPSSAVLLYRGGAMRPLGLLCRLGWTALGMCP